MVGVFKNRFEKVVLFENHYQIEEYKLVKMKNLLTSAKSLKQGIKLVFHKTHVNHIALRNTQYSIKSIHAHTHEKYF